MRYCFHLRPAPLILWLALLVSCGTAQQVADLDFSPRVSTATYPQGTGPRVAIDEAHNNFHTLDGRYQTFAKVLRLNGYQLSKMVGPISAVSLSRLDVLVIANPLADRNREEWNLPTPSAFTKEETEALSGWVRTGGRLFLIADHMPFAGAVSALAKAFEIEYRNGFAYLGEPATKTGIFDRKSGMLRPHPITDGPPVIRHVQTFMGSAFRGEGLEPLLVLPPGSISREPSVAWEFRDDTPQTDVSGWFQGAVKPWGRGRIAVFGEAAMFSAQLAGPKKTPFGMNSPTADENAQFLTNVMRWLTEGVAAQSAP